LYLLADVISDIPIVTEVIGMIRMRDTIGERDMIEVKDMIGVGVLISTGIQEMIKEDNLCRS